MGNDSCGFAGCDHQCSLLSEYGAVRVHLPGQRIGAPDQHEAQNRLDKAGGRGTADVIELQQAPVDIGIQGIGGVEQQTIVHRHLVEQAEVRIEHSAQVHNGQGDDGGFQARQGDIPDLVPGGSAVNHRRLVIGRINAHQGSVVHNGGIAHAAPELDKRQNKGPVFGLGIPTDGFAAQRLDDAVVQEAAVLAQEGKGQVGDDGGGEDMGQQDAGLVDLQQLFLLHLTKQYGRGHSRGSTQNDEGQIVKHGIAEDDCRILGLEQILEVGQAAPGAFENTQGIVDLFKCQHNARHGDIIVEQQVDKARDHKKDQGPVLLSGALLLKPITAFWSAHKDTFFHFGSGSFPELNSGEER